MILPQITSEPMGVLSFAAFTLSLTGIFYKYSRQMLRERWIKTHYPEAIITTNMVYQYFKEQGCNVWHVRAEINTTSWSAFLTQNGKCYIAKVFTDGVHILVHEHTLA